MNIAVLPGDGIGPEVIKQAVRVLKALERRGLNCEFHEAPVGASAAESGVRFFPLQHLPWRGMRTQSFSARSEAMRKMLYPRGQRPGDALLHLRKALALYANLRPAIMYPELIGASTLKPEIVRGLDLIVLRELNGDVYFGEPRQIGTTADGCRFGMNTMIYREDEVARIAHVGFKAAQKRRGKLCSVDKANVLETSELWRMVLGEVGKSYPDVELTNMYVDAAAMTLVRKPAQFDLIVTGNIFGDILSDEVAMLTGSIGMLPSASLGDGSKGLYEPVHGSAPDIAGRDIANPLAAILSASMMLRWSFGLEEAASRIEEAIRNALAKGYRTADIAEPGGHLVGTEEMGAAVAERI